MNHEKSEMLWVRSDQPPYDDLGYMAVRYGSELEKSLFASDYKQEFTKAYLDNLNVLYVAFTRAEEGLIVMAPLPPEKKNDAGKIRDVGQLLFDSIQTMPELLKNFDGKSIYAEGEIEVLAEWTADDGFDAEYEQTMLVHVTRSWKLSSNAALWVVLDASHISGRIKGKNIVKRVSH